jgi:hypothetical protein
MLLLRLGVLLWSLLGFALPCVAVDFALAALERQVHDLVNVHRQARGLSPLAYNEEIASIARRHSQDMATGRAGVGHQGVEERRNDLVHVIAFKEFAENVGGNSYVSSRTAHETVEGWLKSLGHRQNIEGDFNLTGVGIAQSTTGLYFFTQIFLTTSETRSNSDESNRSISRLNLSWLVLHPLRKRSRAGSLSLSCVILIVASPETFELR